jgi:hypothetical protein
MCVREVICTVRPNLATVTEHGAKQRGDSLAYELLYNCEHLSLHLAQQLMQTCAVFYMGALASDASVIAVLDLQ